MTAGFPCQTSVRLVELPGSAEPVEPVGHVFRLLNTVGPAPGLAALRERFIHAPARSWRGYAMANQCNLSHGDTLGLTASLIPKHLGFHNDVNGSSCSRLWSEDPRPVLTESGCRRGLDPGPDRASMRLLLDGRHPRSWLGNRRDPNAEGRLQHWHPFAARNLENRNGGASSRRTSGTRNVYRAFRRIGLGQPIKLLVGDGRIVGSLWGMR